MYRVLLSISLILIIQLIDSRCYLMGVKIVLIITSCRIYVWRLPTLTGTVRQAKSTITEFIEVLLAVTKHFLFYSSDLGLLIVI